MNNYNGQRLSFQGERCTVRFIGSLNDKAGDWLGVEWDHDSKGKHDGVQNGVRYFSCESISQTAGSFIRPSRPSDKPLSLIEAIQEKYASPFEGTDHEDEVIQISGKAVEEVGFERIRRQLAGLTSLKIIILDNLCINGLIQASSSNLMSYHEDLHVKEITSWLSQMKIEELDLSRNLLERWAEILLIIYHLPKLKILKLAGNRFRDLSTLTPNTPKDQAKLTELAMDETLLDFKTITSLIRPFPALLNLSVSYNQIREISTPIDSQRLRRIDLSYNSITSLQDIHPLTTLPSLTELSLRSNPITNLNNPGTVFSSLKTLDLTSTLLPTLTQLNAIPTTFPQLTHLLTKSTPLSHQPTASLLTISRIPSLTSLNFSSIAPSERQEAELYYLSTITKNLTNVSSPIEEVESNILLEHPQWLALCEKHGKPDIPRKPTHGATQDFPAGSLGARMARFEFRLQQDDDGSYAAPAKVKSKLIPTTISIYRLQGLAASLFDLSVLKIKLILETDELDPVGGDEGEWSESESESEDGLKEEGSDRGEERGDGIEGKGERNDEEEESDGSVGKVEVDRWVRRETELVGSAKPIGDSLPIGFGGKAAVVRIRIERIE